MNMNSIDISGKTILIKIGGRVLDDKKILSSLCADISLLQKMNAKIVIVHGGGKAISRALEKKNIKSIFRDGIRVTSKESMVVIKEVLLNEMAVNLADLFKEFGTPFKLISSLPSSNVLCIPYAPGFGKVGKVVSFSKNFLDLVASGSKNFSADVSIISPVACDADGNYFNINADHFLAALTKVLKSDYVFYITDQEGVLNKDGETISEINYSEIMCLIKDKTIKGGMIAKVNSVMESLSSGIRSVTILSGLKRHSLIDFLFFDQTVGTECVL